MWYPEGTSTPVVAQGRVTHCLLIPHWDLSLSSPAQHRPSLAPSWWDGRVEVGKRPHVPSSVQWQRCEHPTNEKGKPSGEPRLLRPPWQAGWFSFRRGHRCRGARLEQVGAGQREVLSAAWCGAPWAAWDLTFGEFPHVHSVC